MKLTVIILSVLLITTGCIAEPSLEYRIQCDSGFNTSWSEAAGIYDGVIVWKTFEGWKERKMIPGEICHRTERLKEK